MFSFCTCVHNMLINVTFANGRLKFVSFIFVCFVALCPKSTAMVMAGQSVHLTTLFPGQA